MEKFKDFMPTNEMAFTPRRLHGREEKAKQILKEKYILFDIKKDPSVTNKHLSDIKNEIESLSKEALDYMLENYSNDEIKEFMRSEDWTDPVENFIGTTQYHGNTFLSDQIIIAFHEIIK